MKILAIDTSSKYFCLVIAKDDKILREEYEPLGRDLSRLIIPRIGMSLKKARLSLRNIDCFAVGLGPGSFVGLRVGLSTMKGFAFSLNKPMAAVATLDVIAYAGGRAREGWVCPIIDAKRSLVYSAIYSFKNNQLRRKSRYFLTAPQALFKHIKRETNFLGDGVGLYRNIIERQLGKDVNFLGEDLWYPRPKSLLEVLSDKVKNKDFVDSDRVVPLYLYPKECQIKLAK